MCRMVCQLIAIGKFVQPVFGDLSYVAILKAMEGMVDTDQTARAAGMAYIRFVFPCGVSLWLNGLHFISTIVIVH
jgi:hypothetical protein